ncbi:MAG TPA: TetR/AcrR family transcriptional regulator [Acidimicrobiales bacterium]
MPSGAAPRGVPPPIRQRLSREARVEQLLDVAEHVFAEYGYEATSIERLAKAAGVSRPVVYAHFGSKDGIYLACLRRARRQLDEAVLSAVLGVEDLQERLTAGIDATFAFIEAYPARWAVVYNGVAVSGPVAEEAWRLRLSTVDQIAALIQIATPDTPPRQVEAFAHALSGAVEETERWWRHTPGLSRAEAVRQLSDFAWRGVRVLAEYRRPGGPGVPGGAAGPGGAAPEDSDTAGAGAPEDGDSPDGSSI